MPFFSIESSASLRTVQARFALYMILVRFISLSSATTFMMSMKTSSFDLRIIARASEYESYLSFLGVSRRLAPRGYGKRQESTLAGRPLAGADFRHEMGVETRRGRP